MTLLKRLTNSPKALVFSYLLLIVISGAIYWQVEVDKSPGDALWWAVVTASTVGYGDTYPTTWPGRVMAGILISVMILFVIPLITAHFASKLIVDNDAFQHEEQEEIKNQLREIRAIVERLAPADADRTGAALDALEARADGTR
ncbi:potassium channel family protein [Catellatospora methionotrophica]|uniref:potassium channel family protein n=1 Tax=Catellatospora methionotrophica TaxID=121620 RepID=UPI001EF38B13|nr:potassium channel family protein [Catellatospora methionotrophica]